MKFAQSFRSRCVILTGTAALVFAAPVVAEPSYQLTSGATKVTLAPELLAALESLGVEAGSVLPAGLAPEGDKIVAGFPIPAGDIDAGKLKLEILHSGGLTLTAGHTRVALTSFIIDNLKTKNPVLTGIVKVNDTIVGRIPLFVVQVVSTPALTPPAGAGNGHLRIHKTRLKLTAAAAHALNQAFGLDETFKEGFTIGHARVSARLRDND